jgi:hypothetical protein
MTPQAKALMDHILARSAHIGEAAEQLAELAVDLATESRKAMDDLEAEERRVSAGYLRRAPSHRARSAKPLVDAITDDWISTGKESHVG